MLIKSSITLGTVSMRSLKHLMLHCGDKLTADEFLNILLQSGVSPNTEYLTVTDFNKIFLMK